MDTKKQNQPQPQAETQAVAVQSKGECTYLVAGSEVKLSYDIVRNFLVRGNQEKVTTTDLVQFISICKFNQLNPFLNEAYLVKYGDAPAQMVVSKEALMKRADACPHYQGIQGGIIVKRGDDVVEEEGCFIMPGDVLLGGWARVYRDDRRYPIVARVSLAEYNTGKSLWNGKPTTMIAKVAKVQALREAFPNQLGAIYIQEETIQDAEYTEVSVAHEKAVNANKTAVDFAAPAISVPASELKPTPAPENDADDPVGF